jgi:hypothetical protein
MRKENSLQTAARWTGKAVIGVSFLAGLFTLFTVVVGTVIWWCELYALRNKPRKYKAMLKQRAHYTDAVAGLEYLLLFGPLVVVLFIIFVAVDAIGDNWIVKAYFHWVGR